MNKKILTFFVLAITALSLLPNYVSALELSPYILESQATSVKSEISAPAYIVTDAKSGKVLLQKNAATAMTAASLTKVIAALVVLDAKPDLNKSIAITKADQVAGACGRGGGCIKAKAGARFTIDGLFHAAMLPSANNAANALARSTGLSSKQFAAKMNAKAKALGATRSRFVEPTGMNRSNVTTASDYAKIMAFAAANPYLSSVAQKSSFYLTSTSHAAYNQNIKTSNRLLAHPDLKILVGKTGYLTKFNFASVMQIRNGAELSVVVLGEKRFATSFTDAKQLADRAQSILDQVAVISTP